VERIPEIFRVIKLAIGSVADSLFTACVSKHTPSPTYDAETRQIDAGKRRTDALSHTAQSTLGWQP
jgi:hypothetical protein